MLPKSRMLSTSMARRVSLVEPPTTTTAAATTTTTARAPSSSKVMGAEIVDDGKTVRVQFEDKSTFAFHSLWLRDACRDDRHVVKVAGERQLTATAAMLATPASLVATSLKVTEDGGLTVWWGGDSTMVGGVDNTVGDSVFTSAFLHAYADVVAKPLTPKPTAGKREDLEWLRPYTGYPDAKAPLPGTTTPWTNADIEAKRFQFTTMQYDDVLQPAGNLDLLKTLMRDGVVLVDNVPSTDDAALLNDFAYRALGGLQKDPTRDEANWKITKKDGATSVSYAHDKRLINHTDQSVPTHGIPGVILIMHYLKGTGANTLCDGFAAAEELRRVDPEAFRLLATYGYDAERDFIASRVDSTQDHNKSLLIARKNPIFTLDGDGNLVRIMYNEVFRTPLTLPFDVFTPWYNAFNKYVQLLHSPVRVCTSSGRNTRYPSFP